GLPLRTAVLRQGSHARRRQGIARPVPPPQALLAPPIPRERTPRMYQMNRRQVLLAIGASLALAGCGSSSNGDSDSEKKDGVSSANREGAMDNYGVGTQFTATVP